MATNIGALAVTISANAAAFHKTIDGVMAKLRGLASLPLLGGAASFFNVPTSVHGFLDMLKEGQDRILALGRASDRLGISLSEAAGIKFLAGDRADDFTAALGKMQKFLGEVRAGAPEAITKLKGLGLTKDVAALPTSQAYESITGSINGMGNAFDRVASGSAVFGKQFVGVADLMKKSWGDATAQVEELGENLTKADVAMARMQVRQMKILKERKEQAENKLAATAAPYLEQFYKDLNAILSGDVSLEFTMKPTPFAPGTDKARARAAAEAKEQEAKEKEREQNEASKAAGVRLAEEAIHKARSPSLDIYDQLAAKQRALMELGRKHAEYENQAAAAALQLLEDYKEIKAVRATEITRENAPPGERFRQHVREGRAPDRLRGQAGALETTAAA